MNSVAEPAEEQEETLFAAPPMGEQERMVEAMLFASAAPVTARDLAARMPHGCDAAEALVRLRKRYEGRGVRVVKVDDAWAVRTAPDLGYLMQNKQLPITPLKFIGCILTGGFSTFHLHDYKALVLKNKRMGD